MGKEGKDGEWEEGNERVEKQGDKEKEERGKRRYITVGKHDGRLARAS